MPDIYINDESKPEPVVESTKTETPVVKKEVKKGGYHHPFRSWMYKPHWVNFESKYDHEEVVLLLRRHPVTNVPWIIIATLMVLAPLVLSSFPIIAFLPPNFQLVAVMIWYLITFAFILENFLIWFFNVGLITNVRLIDIDFLNLLVKEVTDAEHKEIQEVTYNMNGAIRAIFNYGDVFIQTAGEKPNIEFMAVPKPDEVVKILQKLREHKGGGHI